MAISTLSENLPQSGTPYIVPPNKVAIFSAFKMGTNAQLSIGGKVVLTFGSSGAGEDGSSKMAAMAGQQIAMTGGTGSIGINGILIDV